MEEPALRWLAALLLGPLVGSFITAYVARLPERGRGLLVGRSRCRSCSAVLSPQDLLPLVSFLVLRGRCRRCGAKLSWLYPAAEWGALGVGVLAALTLAGPDFWVGLGLGWALLALLLSDLRHYLLPDSLTLPLMPLGLLEGYLRAGGGEIVLIERSLALLAALLLLGGLRFAYGRWRGREGLGLGDVKLAAAGGAWLGLALLPWMLAAAGLMALAYVGLTILLGGAWRAERRIAFGAFLAPAIWLLWLLPDF